MLHRAKQNQTLKKKKQNPKADVGIVEMGLKPIFTIIN